MKKSKMTRNERSYKFVSRSFCLFASECKNNQYFAVIPTSISSRTLFPSLSLVESAELFTLCYEDGFKKVTISNTLEAHLLTIVVVGYGRRIHQSV
jgi:hypothetical protein